jgi:hypothetical protein
MSPARVEPHRIFVAPLKARVGWTIISLFEINIINNDNDIDPTADI